MDEVEEYLERAGATLDDGTPIPTKQREGWTHMAVAAAKLADAFLLGEHTWQEIFPHSCTVADRPEEEWSHYVAQAFVDLCRMEHLRTAYRARAGGGFTDIPSEWWELDDPMLRFRSFGIDPTDPLSDAVPPPFWIWVENASLAESCEVLRRRKYPNNGEPNIIPMAGQFVGVFDAIEILRPFLPEITGPIRPQGAPEGGAELLNLLAAGRLHGVAASMVRLFSRAGEPSRKVETRSNWAVPKAVWKGVVLSPEQDWRSGRFVSRSDERNTYELENVAVIAADLKEYVEAMGVSARVQFRVRNGDDVLWGAEAVIPTSVADALEDDVQGAEQAMAVEAPAPVDAPRKRLNNGRRPTPQQQEAFRFFDLADRAGFLSDPDKLKRQSDLFATYRKQFPASKLRGQPFGFSRFKEMLVLHRQGRRVEAGRWTEKTD